jgi:assimilatory nitrate reductase catalytic subunit
MRCAVGCGHLQRGVDTGYGVDTARGDPEHPVTRGVACRRGTRESADPDGEWLTRPLVRTDGELVPVLWATALETAAEGLRDALARDPNAVGVLGSGQQTTEAAYALGKLTRGGFGTRNYDANTTLCMASAVTAYYDAFGSDAPPPTYDDIPAAESHVVWGANPAVAHPVMFRWIRDSADADDCELLVVDPVETETAAAADRHVAVAPGEDLTLARAVLARVVERDGVDEAFVRGATRGFDDLVDRLPEPAAAATAAGVDLATVDELAAALDRRTLVYWGMGVNQSVDGTATSGALIDLCLATGNLGPGSGPFSLTGQANSMGTRVCSSKGTWPGGRPFEAPDERALVADVWDVPVGRLPDDPGPGPVGVLERVGDEVEALWTVATNPAAGVPDAGSVADRLDDAFLVVQDAFRTETVEHADVVLPAATWGESAGTVVNMERTVSRVRPASDTPPGVRQDVDIVAALADRVVPELDLFEGPPCSPRRLFREWCDLTGGSDADCSGLSYPRLEAETAVRWPAPAPDESGGYRYYRPVASSQTVGADPEPESESAAAAATATATEAEADGSPVTGTATTDGGPDGTEPEPAADGVWSFPTPSGRARFSTVVSGRTAEPTDEAYPVTLTTGRVAEAYNTGVRSRSGPGEGTPPVARVAPATLSSVAGETADGDGRRPLRVVSRRGTVRVRAEADPAVPAGVVWLPIHHPRTNELTTPARDPRSAEPNFKQCAVRLEPVEPALPATADVGSSDAADLPAGEGATTEAGPDGVTDASPADADAADEEASRRPSTDSGEVARR